MRSMWAPAIAGILAFGVSQTASAQERKNEDTLGSRLRTGDRVWVEIDTTDVRAGRVLDVSNGVLRLAADGGEERIPISSIWRVQRKQNGIALGMLIGAGAGFALGLPLADIGANEGTGVAGPLLFMTGVGAAVGTALDAFLWRKRTIYTSWDSGLVLRPNVGPNSPQRVCFEGILASLLSKLVDVVRITSKENGRTSGRHHGVADFDTTQHNDSPQHNCGYSVILRHIAEDHFVARLQTALDLDQIHRGRA